jgi:hypothetical protein
MKNWQKKIELIGNELYFPAHWIYNCEEGPTTSKPLGFYNRLIPVIAEDILEGTGDTLENVVEFLTELCEVKEDEE